MLTDDEINLQVGAYCKMVRVREAVKASQIETARRIAAGRDMLKQRLAAARKELQ